MTGLAKDISEKVLRFVTGQASLPAVPSVFFCLGRCEAGGFAEISCRVQVAGPAFTNGATSTSSPMINHASVPPWVAAGMQAYSETAGQAIGIVRSAGERQVILADPAAIAIGSGHTITYSAFVRSDNTVANGAMISVTAADANAWALFDAPSGGGMLWLGDLSGARSVAIIAGDQIILPPGAITMTLAGPTEVPQARAAAPLPEVAASAPEQAPAPPVSLSRAPRGRTAVARA